VKPVWRAYLKHQPLHTNWKHKLAAWNNWTSLFTTELNIRTSLIVLPQATPLRVTSVGCNHTAFDLRYNVLINLNSCITHHGPLLYTSAHQTVNLQPPSHTSVLHSIGHYILTSLPHARKSTAPSASDMASARGLYYDSNKVRYS
jgi:hypothetical protein